MNVWSMYFSGTGSTEAVTTALGKEVSAQLNGNFGIIDFTPPSTRNKRIGFAEDDLVILGLPVIAGRVPNLLLEYLNSIDGGSGKCIPMVSYGNRAYDDALLELCHIAKDDGFQVIGAGAISCEHSFSYTLGRGRPDAEDMDEIIDFGKSICSKVRRENLEKGGHRELEISGEYPSKGYYIPRDEDGNRIDIRHVKPKTSKDCNNCGLCTRICPLGSIETDDVSMVSGICMKCCGCIKKCPQHAKYFDDEGFLYHKRELEERFGSIRGKNDFFI